MAANLREAFKENGLLLRKFQKAQVFVDAPVVMVPVEEFVEEEAENMYKYVLTDCDNIETLHYIMPETNAVALFGISKDLKMVLTDNIPNVRSCPLCSLFGSICIEEASQDIIKSSTLAFMIRR